MGFQLTSQQQAVLDWSDTAEPGSLLVLEARAGCGKTSTLLSLVEHRAFLGCGNMFVGAYNKSIAGEIKAKLAEEGIDWKICNAGTMHSAGLSAWRRLHRNVQVDSNKCRDLWRGCAAKKTDAQKSQMREAEGFVLALVSLAKQRVERPCEAIVEHFDIADKLPESQPMEQAIRWACGLYDLSLKKCPEIVDYDDMILAPVAFNVRVWQYDLVVIDEAQDLNESRRQLAHKLMSPKGRMVIVGDPAQAIYGFAGADSDSMDRMKEMFSD